MEEFYSKGVVSRLKSRDVLRFEHKDGITPPKEADRFYFNVVGANNVLRVAKELRECKRALEARGETPKIGGLANALEYAAPFYKISVLRGDREYALSDVLNLPKTLRAS